MNPAIVISAQDNVATALEALAAGQTIQAGAAAVAIVEAIPRGHKVALRDIAAGTHVHTHNVASDRGRGDLAASGDAR